VPLHAPIVVPPLREKRRFIRLVRTTAIALAACSSALSATASAERSCELDTHRAQLQTGSCVPSDAESSQPQTSRYFDLEANKANSMRTLGLATTRKSVFSPYWDLEANKARTQRAR
jgi:hypothetical protein